MRCDATLTIEPPEVPEGFSNPWRARTYRCALSAGHAGDHETEDGCARWEADGSQILADVWLGVEGEVEG